MKFFVLVSLLCGCMVTSQGQTGLPTVRYNEIVANREPQNWLTYSGNYRGWHYSPLDQIDLNDVKDLGLQWVFNNGQTGKLEATPLIIDGVMYVPLLNNDVFALDARTGRQIWAYHHASVPQPASRF